MADYTTLNDPGADEAVHEALAKVVEAILDLMGEYVGAIVLTGGFGRGEGGVVKENGRFRPVNDFDISVIVSKGFIKVRKAYASRLQELAEQLASETGVKQIDIGINHPLQFRFAPNLVASYEVKYGHRVLWGNVDLKTLMPPLPTEKLPFLDAGIYFFSRGSGLLIPALYFLSRGTIEERHRENFQIEIQKACLAIGDAWLILNRRYHYSYQERQRRVLEADMGDMPQWRRMKEKYQWAVEQKLQPRFGWDGDRAMVDLWYEVRDLFGECFLFLEGNRLGRDFSDWMEYSKAAEHDGGEPFSERLRQRLKSAYHHGIAAALLGTDRNVFFDSRRFKWAAMPAILFSLGQKQIEPELLTVPTSSWSLKKQKLQILQSG